MFAARFKEIAVALPMPELAPVTMAADFVT